MKLKQQKVKRRNSQKSKKENRLNKKEWILAPASKGGGEMEY
jgi:hypothetical protein